MWCNGSASYPTTRANQCLNQSIYLAAAGILAGQDATTHWA